MNNYYYYYVKSLTIILSLILFPIFYFYLNNEYMSHDKIIEKQSTSHKKILYGPSLGQNDPFVYKKEMIERLNP